MADEELTFWERLGRIPAHSLKAQLLYISAFMAFATIVNVLLALVMRSLIPIASAIAGWLFVGVYGLVRVGLADRTAGNIGKILVPSGSSTPSVAQHSNIEALVARGKYAEAAAAYRAVIAAEPEDLVSCEQLARLAMRELKDYDLAVWAYREAERRTTEPRRKAGFALLVVGLFRDNLRDTGRTIVEMRRLLERFPDIPNAAQLRAELDDLRARHFEGK